VLTITHYTQPAHGTVVLNPTGTLTYTPTANYTGTDTFTYTVSDEASPWHIHGLAGLFFGGGHTSTTTATITITPIDDAPVAVNDGPISIAEDSGPTLIDVLVNDIDPDGDPKQITAITQPTHGTATISGTAVSYTPTPNFNGPDAFTYTLNGASTATINISVTAVDDNPVANPDFYSTYEDNAYIIDALYNDTDIDDGPKEITAVTQPANGTTAIIEGIAIIYTPDADFNGTDSFTYTVSGGSTAAVTFTVIPVPDAAVAIDDSVTTAEDTAVLVDALGNDLDADGDALVRQLVTAPGNGTLAEINDGPNAGAWTYTPYADFNGTDTFTYRAFDGTSYSDAVAVRITVTAVNDAPLANPDTYSTTEDAALTVTVPNGVTGNDSDPDDNAALTATVIDQPTHGALTLNPNGTFSYTPNANYIGTDTFTYRAFDGTDFSATGTVTIAVTPRQITANNDIYTAITGSTITLTPTANDTTSLASPLGDIRRLTQPANGFIFESFGVLSYRSHPDFLGTDSFTYLVADSADPTIVSKTATVTINVVRPITANDDTYTAVTGATVELTPALTVNDTTMLNSPLGGVRIVTEPTNGLLFQNNGVITYRSWNGYLGTDSFTYTVSDRFSSDTVSNVATVTITVVPYNPLTASDDAYTILGRPTVLTPTANDTSDLHRPLGAITVAAGPEHGTLTQANGVMTYTPTAGYAGTDTFTYTVSDSADPTTVSNTATVTLTVIAYNPILANEDTYSVPFNTPTVLTPAVTVNDTTDLGTPLGDVSIVDNPSHGTLSTSGGVLTYTPNAGYSGTDTFTYTVRDSVDPIKVSVPGTVTLTVHPFSPIVARSDVYTVLSGTFTKLLPFVTANDTGSINGLGPITIVTAPSHGYLVQEDGVLTYRAGNDFTGTDTFTYTVSDSFYSDIVSNPATVTLTIVDSMPVYAAEDDVLVFTNEPIALTPKLFFNDRFASGNPPGPINVLIQPVYGTLSESNGTLIYTPNPDFNGVDSLIYTVADSGDPSIVSLPTLVTLTVTDAITASNDFYYASPGQTIEFDPIFTYNDINRTGHALTDPVVGPTRGGTITKIGTKYYYTAPPNFTGFDSFYYTVADSEDPTHSASGLVQVLAIDANGNYLR
jgi:VCBS repeat-containing protein